MIRSKNGHESTTTLFQEYTIQRFGRTSRTTLTKYMADLTDKGIVTPKQEGREIFYINHDLINILENS